MVLVLYKSFRLLMFQPNVTPKVNMDSFKYTRFSAILVFQTQTKDLIISWAMGHTSTE